MKVLVTGCRGQVGRELMGAAWPAGTAVTGVARPEFDLAKPDGIEAAVGAAAPDIVINAAAYTAVDKAESDRATAFAVNADGPGLLAAACARRDVPLIHLSTDYVFDGASAAPYAETDPVCPLGVYGASKAAGEAAVRLRQPRHVIVRTAWVYAAHGHNFVRTMLRLGREREEVGVVADQRGTPTSAADIAAGLVQIVQRIAARTPADAFWGTYHFTASGDTTWHGLAEHIFRQQAAATGSRPRLKAIATADYPTPARRPANSRLDCALIEGTFGIVRRPWQAGVDDVLAELLSPAGQNEARAAARRT